MSQPSPTLGQRLDQMIEAGMNQFTRARSAVEAGSEAAGREWSAFADELERLGLPDRRKVMRRLSRTGLDIDKWLAGPMAVLGLGEEDEPVRLRPTAPAAVSPAQYRQAAVRRPRPKAYSSARRRWLTS